MLFNKCLIGSYCRTKHNRFVADTKYGCYLCWSNFADSSAYQSHMKQHSNSVKVVGFNASWKSLEWEFIIFCWNTIAECPLMFNFHFHSNIELIEVNSTVNRSELTLNLKNNSNGIVKISQIAVYNSISPVDYVQPNDFPIVLETGWYWMIFTWPFGNFEFAVQTIEFHWRKTWMDWAAITT